MVSEQSQAGNDRLVQTRPSGGSGGSDLGATAQDAAQSAKQAAQDVMQQTKETAGQVVEQAKAQATSQLDDRKDRAVESFGSVADALRQAGHHLRQNDQAPIAHYADKAADRVEQWAHHLRGKDVQEIIRDVEDYARRQPALFVGGAFVVGLLAARFLKSSARRDEGVSDRPGYQSYQGYHGYGSGGYPTYRGGRYRGSVRPGYYGGSYETSGRGQYYGGEPSLRERGYAPGTTNYGADRVHDGVDTGPYRAGMGERTGTSIGSQGAAGERGWNTQGRETQ